MIAAKLRITATCGLELIRATGGKTAVVRQDRECFEGKSVVS
jgi:ribosomal protein S27E